MAAKFGDVSAPNPPLYPGVGTNLGVRRRVNKMVTLPQSNSSNHLIPAFLCEVEHKYAARHFLIQ